MCANAHGGVAPMMLCADNSRRRADGLSATILVERKAARIGGKRECELRSHRSDISNRRLRPPPELNSHQSLVFYLNG
jgi:hypothetical protein